MVKTKKQVKKNRDVLKIKKESSAVMPCFAHEGDAGLDIFSNQEAVIKPFHRTAVSTGLYLELPKNYVGLVWDKSGLALNSGVKTMAGVIDSSYRGELKIVLVNLSRQAFRVEKGMKIAQLLIQKVEKLKIQEAEFLEETSRQEKGFGSTGLFYAKKSEDARKKLPERKKELEKIKNALE